MYDIMYDIILTVSCATLILVKVYDIIIIMYDIINKL